MTILVSPGQDKFNTSPSSPDTVYSASVGVRLAKGLWRTILYWERDGGTETATKTKVAKAVPSIATALFYWLAFSNNVIL